MTETIRVTFLDSGRNPVCPPNPDYPDGIDVDISGGAQRTCVVKLPYPAPRCGAMFIECDRCGTTAYVTVAGRVDDPRTVKLACKGPAVQ